jgi:zinc transport system substrate-binding protein
MDDADVFLWVGSILETGMERVVSGLDADVITSLDLPGMKIYYIAGIPDPHVWLDTDNAVIIASALAQALAGLDPGNTLRYAANLDAFTRALESTKAEIVRLLEPENFPPYVVYHNGYQYFEFQFGLAHQASFTTNEDLQPGIRQVMAIKSVIDERNIQCVVVGPSVNTKNLDNQLARNDMQFVVVDVLANAVVPAKDAYSQWLTGVARAFTACRP